MNCRPILFLLALLTTVSACNNPRDKKQIEEGPDRFTCNIQRAGYDHSQSDDLGKITQGEFIEEFSSYPWMEELEKAKHLSDKCAPTLTVVDEKTKRDFWISMAGDRNEHGYFIGYIYVNTSGQRWVEVYTTQNRTAVDGLIDLFFERNYDQFESKLRKLDFEFELESEDLAK